MVLHGPILYYPGHGTKYVVGSAFKSVIGIAVDVKLSLTTYTTPDSFYSFIVIHSTFNASC